MELDISIFHYFVRFVRTVIPQFTDADFQSHFRMSRPSFEALVVFCDTHKLPDSAIFPHRSIQPVPMNEMLYMTLWYLANQCTHREISVLFDRSISTVWRSVNNITKIIERHLQSFIKWPTAEEVPVIAENFRHIAGFPGAIGAMDGTHIEIVTPSENQKDYNNRKMRHSLILLAVCLPNRAFSYTFAGFPGSANDSRVFRCSDLGVRLDEDPTSLFPGAQYHLLSDCAFSCSPHIMPSIKTSLANTVKKRNYNTILSKTRIIIEHAFGALKNTWRRLRYIYAHVKKASRIISCCCALHNFLISRGERMVNYRALDADNENVDEIADDWFDLQSGIQKRNEIIDLLYYNNDGDYDMEDDE